MRCSYRACFKPQLPEFFIARLTQPGDGVYDPFMGRGTTPVQAALQARRAMGNDINPLSVMLTRPRLAPPSLVEIETRLRELPWSVGEIEREDLLAFYHPETLRQIGALRRYLLDHAPPDGEPDNVDDWIRMVALNRLTGHSPGFFSVYSLPPNQAVSVEAQLKINARRKQTPPPRDVAALIMKKSRALLADGRAASATTCATRRRRGVEYALYRGWLRAPHRHFAALSRCRAILQQTIGYAIGSRASTKVASTLRRIGPKIAWAQMVRACFIEFARVVAPGGHVAFEVGEVRGGKMSPGAHCMARSREPPLRAPLRAGERTAIHKDQ